MEFNQNFDDPKFFEEAHIPYVDMVAATNVKTSRCRRQGTFLVLQFCAIYSNMLFLFKENYLQFEAAINFSH
jgi:hypothetical protein